MAIKIFIAQAPGLTNKSLSIVVFGRFRKKVFILKSKASQNYVLIFPPPFSPAAGFKPPLLGLGVKFSTTVPQTKACVIQLFWV